MKRYLLLFITLSVVERSLCFAQDLSAARHDSVSWGPVIQLTQDSTENYTPHIVTTGDTIHCIWQMSGEGSMMMPYIRSVNDGISFEEPRDLVDTSVLQFPFDHAVFFTNNGELCLGFNPPVGPGNLINTQLRVMFSYDKGTTWTTPRIAMPDCTGIYYGGAMYNDTIAILAGRQVRIDRDYTCFARSTNGGTSWSWSQDSFALQTASVAMSPGTLHFTSDAGINPNEFYGEVSYRRSTNLGTTWFSTDILSTDDIYGSDYSALGAYTDDFGRSTIALAWRDPKYGFCGLLGGGIPFRLSTDNGESWSDEIPLHENDPCGYKAKVAVRENVIAVVWTRNGGSHIKIKISLNHGAAWSELFDLSAGGVSAGEPSIALSSSAVHIVWEEAVNGHFNIFYCRGQLPITSVKDEEQVEPITITLEQNFPNPFNPKTAISFQQSAVSDVTLKVYDIFGKEVATLIHSRKMDEGMHSVEWDAENFPSGMYFYRLTAMNRKNQTTTQTKKMLFLK
jgi:hypothetical protein